MLSPQYVCFSRYAPPHTENFIHMIAEDTRQVEEAHPDFFGVQMVYVWPQGLDVM